MDLDHLLFKFFGTEEIASLSPDQLAMGSERLRLQFGLEQDGGRRFALWCLMFMLGTAPDLDIAFKVEADRQAARAFMEAAEREVEQEQ